jgi:four helix bundle protein
LVRFLSIAAGSASELEYHLLLAHDLGILNRGAYGELARDVGEVKKTPGRTRKQFDQTHHQPAQTTPNNHRQPEAKS